LLSEHPTKNCDTLAQINPGTSEQSLQNLLTTMRWDDIAVNAARVQRMRALPTDGDGVPVLDDMGFVKKGTASVGVARQYTSTTGKVHHCQVAITCVYAERTVSWPVSVRLYLPHSWADHSDRREQPAARHAARAAGGVRPLATLD
jgi:SRSO17 transposase